MKQNSSILWLPSIFRAKHQTPWLRKAKDFVWPRAKQNLCFTLLYFETPKESLASSTAQPTQVLQKNWLTGQEKTELNFDTWWIQRAIFTPPSCGCHQCYCHQHWQLCGLYWNSPGRAEQTGPAKPPPHQAAHPEHPQISTASIRNLQRQVCQSMPSIQTDF